MAQNWPTTDVVHQAEYVINLFTKRGFSLLNLKFGLMDVIKEIKMIRTKFNHPSILSCFNVHKNLSLKCREEKNIARNFTISNWRNRKACEKG